MNPILMDSAGKYWGLPRKGLKMVIDPYKDTYGRNILPIGSENFVTGWINGAGETCSIIDFPVIIDGELVVAKRITGNGLGSSVKKYTISLLNRLNPHTDVITVWVQKLNPTTCYLKHTGIISAIISSEMQKLSLSVTNLATTFSSIDFNTLNTGDIIDIVVYHPQLNINQPYAYTIPSGLPLNPLEYYKKNTIQNGSNALGVDSADIAFTGNSMLMGSPSDLDNYLKISPAPVANLEKYTCITVCNALTAGGGGFGRIFDKANGANLTGQLSYIDSAGKLIYARYSSVANYKQWQSNIAVPFNTNNVFILRGQRDLVDTSNSIFVNGVKSTPVVSSEGTPTLVDDSANDLYLGNRLGIGRYFDGQFYLHVWYDRMLSDAECIKATRNIKNRLLKRGIVI